MFIVFTNLLLIFWSVRRFGQLNAQQGYRGSVLESTYPDFKNYIWPSVLVGFLSQDWRSEFLNQSKLWRSQVWDYRRFLFSGAQGVFSLFGLLLALILFYELNSYLVVFIGLAINAAGVIKKFPGKSFLRPLSSGIFLALILFFVELSFRNSSLLTQFLSESEIVYFTTVDAFSNILILLAASTVLSIFIPIQGWSIVVTYLCFLNSQLSYLGCMFIVVGEFLGMNLHWLRSIRRWDNYYKKRIFGLVVWVLGYLVLFLTVLYIWRNMVNFGNTFNQLFMLKWLYISTLIIFLAGLYTTIMCWGHFKSQGKNKDKDVASTDAGLIHDFKNQDEDAISNHIRKQLNQRRTKLIEFKTELDIDPQSKSKIPRFVLNQFEQEIKLIDQLNHN